MPRPPGGPCPAPGSVPLHGVPIPTAHPLALPTHRPSTGRVQEQKRQRHSSKIIRTHYAPPGAPCTTGEDGEQHPQPTDLCPHDLGACWSNKKVQVAEPEYSSSPEAPLVGLHLLDAPTGAGLWGIRGDGGAPACPRVAKQAYTSPSQSPPSVLAIPQGSRGEAGPGRGFSEHTAWPRCAGVRRPGPPGGRGRGLWGGVWGGCPKVMPAAPGWQGAWDGRWALVLCSGLRHRGCVPVREVPVALGPEQAVKAASSPGRVRPPAGPGRGQRSFPARRRAGGFHGRPAARPGASSAATARLVLSPGPGGGLSPCVPSGRPAPVAPE